MAASIALFTYGTLQHTDIQLKLFSRKLSGTPQILTHYKLGTIKLPENHPQASTYFIALYTGNPDDCITGMLYSISKEELWVTDAYEGPAYERSQVVLKSGKKALVYRKASS